MIGPTDLRLNLGTDLNNGDPQIHTYGGYTPDPPRPPLTEEGYLP
jgi:hypothetical protein